MYACCDGGRLDNIQTLIKNGADIKARDSFGSTLLHFASHNSKPEVVEFFLKMNEISINLTDINKSTPLMLTCFNGGRLDIMRKFIENGADIKVRDLDGATLLHLASRHSRQEVLEFLLEFHEISVNAVTDDNLTPLMYACFDGGRLDNIRTLISNGGDINIKSKVEKCNIFHFACAFANLDVVEFLVGSWALELNTYVTDFNQPSQVLF